MRRIKANVMLKTFTLSLLAASLLTSCASISTDKVDRAAKSAEDTIRERQAQQAAIVAPPLVQRVRNPYLGTQPINLAYEATLPPVFRDVTLRFPGRSNLSTVAARITEATKLPVHIRPDVFLSAKALVASASGVAATGVPAPSGAPTGVPTPLPRPGAAFPPIPAAGVATQTLDDFDLSLPTDYSGSLAGYLDLISSRLGINWEYREGSISLYRMVTKVFVVKLNPGAVDFSSSLTKGGASGSGAAGGGSGGDNGSFSSQSSTTLSGKYSVWASLEAAILGMKTPLGKVTVDQSAGHIIVTDTKDVVDEIGKVIDIENTALTRQVQIDVRLLRVAFADDAEIGVDLNLVYSKISQAATDWSFGLNAPGSLVSSMASGMGFNILSPTNRFSGSTLFVRALKEVGKVVSDKTITATTTNRLPVPIGQFSTVTYLAETKPAAAGGAGNGAGVPGLTPGQVTTGFFLNVIPTALENNSVLLRLSMDQSDLLRIGSISTGSGQTLQQIQTPEVQGTKSDHSVGLKEGESLVLMGISADNLDSGSRTGFGGFSKSAKNAHEMQIIIVTPKVRPGV
jgi:type IVB pilus formation R64 PilN family outer membrane protein